MSRFIALSLTAVMTVAMFAATYGAAFAEEIGGV